MKKQEFNPSKAVSEILHAYQPDFKPFFETRLMAKMAQLSEQTYLTLFQQAFQRVLFAGMAAVVLLLLVIFVSDAHLSADVLIGTNNLDLESLTAMQISALGG